MNVAAVQTTLVTIATALYRSVAPKYNRNHHLVIFSWVIILSLIMIEVTADISCNINSRGYWGVKGFIGLQGFDKSNSRY
jgi:ABC-type multidrug transport system permease subunit